MKAKKNKKLHKSAIDVMFSMTMLIEKLIDLKKESNRNKVIYSGGKFIGIIPDNYQPDSKDSENSLYSQVKAKEKAIELYKKFDLEPQKPIFSMSPSHIKQCALIAVDEILNESLLRNDKIRDWWKQVKHEIQKL